MFIKVMADAICGRLERLGFKHNGTYEYLCL